MFHQVLLLKLAQEVPLAHISDVTIFYVQLVEAIVRGDQLPTGKDGYFFLAAYTVTWWEILERLAAELYGRGLVDTVEVSPWPSDDVVAEAVGVPVKFAHSIWNAGSVISLFEFRK